MKKILIIAPASFPVTGAESIVNIKLLRALSESGGFLIDLVSKNYKSIDYPSDSLDKYGVKLNSLHTISVDNRITLKTIWQHIANYLFLGVVFKGCHWEYAAFPIIKKLLKENRYDYVLTKGEVALPLGFFAKKKGFKWVATWNDPCPSSMYPPPYGYGVDFKGSYSDRKLITMMRKADCHIFPSERLAKYMQPIVLADSNKVFIIPHVVIISERHHSEGETLRLIHSGNLLPPRNSGTFLEGFRKFMIENNYPNVKFCILGNLTEKDKNLIYSYDLEKYVEYLAPVEYNSSLDMLNSFDIAVIIEADCAEGIYLPTKVSDFMQMQIPIFSISPKNGTLNDLYKSGNIPYYADVQDVENIASNINKIYSDFKENQIKNNIIPGTFLPQSIIDQYLIF